jgi:xanthine dehydrogenase accessory factor
LRRAALAHTIGAVKPYRKAMVIEIYKEIVRLIERGEKAALATVVGSTGSTPGKESAKMLVRADGTTLGSIGGGCTEADVWALAREVIATDRPLRRSFKLTPRMAEEGGLACGGVVEIFVEPIGNPTVIIFGGGHIARSVAPLAQKVGLNAVVVDDREQFLNRTYFPEPAQLVVSDFATAFQKLLITENSYLVIVTRGHRYDQFVLGEAIKTSASYIGLIGSKAKITRIFRALTAQGADPARLRAVKAPIGLDLGCRMPEEIAVSIVGQLIAHRRRFYLKGADSERLLDPVENDIELPAAEPPPAAAEDRRSSFPAS